VHSLRRHLLLLVLKECLLCLKAGCTPVLLLLLHLLPLLLLLEEGLICLLFFPTPLPVALLLLIL
jgi:hypothetical protein